ncbi:nucleotidyltransferase family protein [Litoreibacter ponti]|uniref:nucleotidyltransferase family protein n=1 Tax=Litoreibacter ponti TaxID=1510457 RepID=UPI001FECF579|nr:nucleotidyltransferase family protein [Litoreibacter ponti]
MTALLLAGGASSRMRGTDKLLEQVRGKALLRDRAEMCLAAGLPCRVVLPPKAPARRNALHGLDVEIVETQGSELGLSHSIRTGLIGLRGDALLVLADLPDLSATHLRRVVDAARAHPLKQVFRGATEAGKPGHPVLICHGLFEELRGIEGDTGAQPVLKAHSGETVLVPIGPAALADLDTPEAWAAWREGQR